MAGVQFDQIILDVICDSSQGNPQMNFWHIVAIKKWVVKVIFTNSI